jgi:hypothetical protein
MTVKALGKPGDQIGRLFSEPVELLVLQHCHQITTAVVDMMDTYAHDLRNPALIHDHRRSRYQSNPEDAGACFSGYLLTLKLTRLVLVIVVIRDHDTRQTTVLMAAATRGRTSERAEVRPSRPDPPSEAETQLAVMCGYATY